MSQVAVFISLLLVHRATQSQSDYHCNCNDDALIPCPGISSMDFTAVAWYKVGDTSGSQVGTIKEGIIRKDKGDEKPLTYHFQREAKLGADYKLVLPRVTPRDSGIYECSINANIGGQNKELRVKLSVHECQAELTTVSLPNSTQSGTWQPEELPVMWSLIGYAAVAGLKILLSLICIMVIRVISAR
ncbi:uncharacterized protein LOC133456261 [Cololabis saira]|uniref:uncharacterized protein LOC133456261 n=1 Tax=Cololabis saira TaxID=129043 RepID=UPI002AD47ECF|nr:uncharacterized protein LOC133456261 [Cololabis saira]